MMKSYKLWAVFFIALMLASSVPAVSAASNDQEQPDLKFIGVGDSFKVTLPLITISMYHGVIWSFKGYEWTIQCSPEGMFKYETKKIKTNYGGVPLFEIVTFTALKSGSGNIVLKQYQINKDKTKTLVQHKKINVHAQSDFDPYFPPFPFHKPDIHPR